jgi:hypothetical protein
LLAQGQQSEPMFLVANLCTDCKKKSIAMLASSFAFFWPELLLINPKPRQAGGARQVSQIRPHFVNSL